MIPHSCAPLSPFLLFPPCFPRGHAFPFLESPTSLEKNNSSRLSPLKNFSLFRTNAISLHATLPLSILYRSTDVSRTIESHIIPSTSSKHLTFLLFLHLSVVISAFFACLGERELNATVNNCFSFASPTVCCCCCCASLCGGLCCCCCCCVSLCGGCYSLQSDTCLSL